ncbi:hypothetical protein ASD44_01440 [Mesorhizobium sp. Root554]|uniref:hypothetical protein n=1 Tax=unclassified Mesorhizobium TaxID=325217 RepID=UPI0006FABA21|nr:MULTISPECIES: hypothetical protein [unclassified Mesorhizobium]KQZ12878.1 hypothetical protein ASD27_01440 [Mesorhizobium sp. Root1471]KQZ35397.1 hypothetical protein ASD44_01440 [Mesorhizobium sp. Root554]
MIPYENDAAENSIREPQVATIQRFLKMGDAQNPEFRQLCYGAAADLLARYIGDNVGTLKAADIRALKENLLASLQAVEAEFPERKNKSERPPLHARTSLSVDAAGLMGELPSPRSAEHISPPPSNTKPRIWQPALTGFFMGGSLLFLCGILLQETGVIYVHRQAEGFEQLKALNESMSSAEPNIENALEVLTRTETKLYQAISSGEIEKNQDVKTKYLLVQNLFPDFFAEIKPLVPRTGNLMLRLSPDGGAYKILLQSEVCGAVALRYPDLVDPVRNDHSIFCRYLGRWNEAGRRL